MKPRKPNSVIGHFKWWELLMRAWPLAHVALSGLVYALLLRVSLPSGSAEYAFWLLMAVGMVGSVKGLPPKVFRVVLEAILSGLPKP